MAKELLFSITKKDLVLQYFSGTGAGGQYRNKHQNCVRLSHPDSGVTVTGQSNRERPSNEREAFQNLVKHPKFKMWHSAKAQELIAGITLKEKVEESLRESNLKVEGKNKEGRWEEIKDEFLV